MPLFFDFFLFHYIGVGTSTCGSLLGFCVVDGLEDDWKFVSGFRIRIRIRIRMDPH
jgi:hypothetical protein